MHPTAPRPRNDLPDAIVGSPLGAAGEDPDHVPAKSGDVAAAMRLAARLVSPELIAAIRSAGVGPSPPPRVVGVFAQESAGKNPIPLAAAKLIARALDLPLELDIVQANAPKRTSLDGLDRIFRLPAFDGPVIAGQDYILVDDTLTQGGTFASLARHIHFGGGRVRAIVALTGKQYSAVLRPRPETIRNLREKHGSIEEAFRAATGHGYDELTESEARYLARYKPAESVRDRILAAAGAQGFAADGPVASGEPAGVGKPAADAAGGRPGVGSAERQLASRVVARLAVGAAGSCAGTPRPS